MKDLDRLKGRTRKAPAQLLPRVMAAVAAEPAKPWWQRAFWSWPAAAQAAYAAGVASAAALVAFGARGAVQAAPTHAALAQALAALSQAQAAAEAGWVVTNDLWRLGGQPLQAMTVVMAGTCAALAAGLARLLEPARRTI